MPDIAEVAVRGVYTHPNAFSGIPDGALRVAKNMDVDRENLATPRPGMPYYGSAIAGAGTEIRRLIPFDGRLVAHHGSTLEYDDGAGSWTAYSTALSEPASGVRVREAIQQDVLYLTSSIGLRRIDSVTDDHYQAGVHEPLDGAFSLSGASGFLSDDSAVRYRAVLYIRLTNDREVVSAPSASLVVPNSAGGSRDVDLTWYLPSGITTDHYWRLYRSAGSEAADDPPDENLQLVAEARVSSTDISNGYITATDSQPDNLRGENLYTNPLEQGIQQANELPPLARDVCEFKGYLFLFNLTGKHRFTLRLIGTGGLSNGNTLNVAGQTYTAAAAEDTSMREFLLATGGTASENIEDTARSIVRNVNADSSSTVYAFYVSGEEDAPGIIEFRERSIGGSAFELSTSTPAAFSPTLPTSDDGSQTSRADRQANFASPSKQNQPEAHPFANRLWTGNGDIVRAIALRESIIVLSDLEVGIITGRDPASFRYDTLDDTTIIKGAATAVKVNDSVYCQSNQGVVQITPQGVRVLSRAIERDLIRARTFTNYEDTAHGIGFDTKRSYYLWQKSVTGDTVAQMCWRYNAFTRQWTFYEFEATCGVVDTATDRLVVADKVTSTCRRERNSYDRTDHADEEWDVTIDAVDGTTITLNSDPGLQVGDLLVKGAVETRITDVSATPDVVVEDTGLTTGAATAYRQIECVVDWQPIALGAPQSIKNMSHLFPLFRDAEFKDLTLSFASDFEPDYSSDYDVAMQPADYGVTWSEIPWGADPADEQVLHTVIPEEMQRNHWLRVRMAINPCRESFAICGLGIRAQKAGSLFRGATQ